MSIPSFDEIIEPNDQTEARLGHLKALRELIGNVYPNKFNRSLLSGAEDSITAIKHLQSVRDVEHEMAIVKENLPEGERPPSDIKDSFNERLRALGNVRIAGRLTTPPRGNFVHLTDGIERLQIYCDKKGSFALIRNDGQSTLDLENGWNAWKLIDHGDFVGVDGYLFVTNTGEVSVHVEKLQFLAKAMVPMPDKMHGIEDPEIKQRQRYVDLIGSSLAVEPEGLTTRQVFETRAKVISSMRNFLEQHGYIEVETPMLTPKATGAAAKPFKTHHNALDIDLYARIAPELYLKRLVVGGFEKVYELNRNFRNEGISYKHNPEFTMLEFYCAYMDVSGMMDFCEELLREAVKRSLGTYVVRINARRVRKLFPGQTNVEPVNLPITVGSVDRFTPEPEKLMKSIVIGQEYLNVDEVDIDFSQFRRKSMKQAVVDYATKLANEFVTDDLSAWLDRGSNAQILRMYLWWLENEMPDLVNVMGPEGPEYEMSAEEQASLRSNKWDRLTDSTKDENRSEYERAGEIIGIFEDYVEELVDEVRPGLLHPTFIVDYPKSVSPLSKASPQDPAVAERFELFINGMEVANGFSELNDPKEQYERFKDQMGERERGDEEAMVLDEDYIRALSYGMPPAAGIGIGIDRLVMLLTNRHSIRDVILFPHMRPERKFATEDTEEEN